MSPDTNQDRRSQASDKAVRQEMLSRLRSERAPTVEAASEQNKLRRAARRKIRSELANGPATVPTLAAATGLPSGEVLWHIAAMRKYGQLAEDAQEGAYFTYRLLAQSGKPDTDE